MTCANNERPAAREPRYPSDMTDAEWAVLEPLLPPMACTLPTGGHREKHPRRNVVDAIRYVNDNGRQRVQVAVRSRRLRYPLADGVWVLSAMAGERGPGPHPC